MSTLQLTTLCLAISLVLSQQAAAQQLNLLQPDLPLTDQSALICEAGDLLGGGGQARAAINDFVPDAGPNRRLVLIELVTRIDADRDRQLDHRELQTLDRLTRQQLLRQLDTNFDRKLSLSELEQELTPQETGQSESRYPQELVATTPPQPETFRNLRRFGIGIQQTSPQPRNQPFARAAYFTKLSSSGDETVDRSPFWGELSIHRQYASDLLSPRR
ncbi:MAG: hypothetical protein GXP24_07030 [Planctomycetes bacterium]|nr:hypothetical protein [Planctomycetota bacterium]